MESRPVDDAGQSPESPMPWNKTLRRRIRWTRGPGETVECGSLCSIWAARWQIGGLAHIDPQFECSHGVDHGRPTKAKMLSSELKPAIPDKREEGRRKGQKMEGAWKVGEGGGGVG
jgi:hypothetical protein